MATGRGSPTRLVGLAISRLRRGSSFPRCWSRAGEPMMAPVVAQAGVAGVRHPMSTTSGVRWLVDQTARPGVRLRLVTCTV